MLLRLPSCGRRLCLFALCFWCVAIEVFVLSKLVLWRFGISAVDDLSFLFGESVLKGKPISVTSARSFIHGCCIIGGEAFARFTSDRYSSVWALIMRF